MQYAGEGKRRSLTIPNIADVSIEAIEGQGGAEVTITNHPLAIAPGQTVVSARSEKLSYKDHGMSWECSGKNGFFSPFQYAS